MRHTKRPGATSRNVASLAPFRGVPEYNAAGVGRADAAFCDLQDVEEGPDSAGRDAG
jgi:hypothetical protein